MHSVRRRQASSSGQLPFLLAAVFLAPILLLAATASDAAASPTFTLATFADGSSSRLAPFSTCTDTDSSSGFLFPYNASIISASLDVTVALNSSSLTGSFSADVGSDGHADGVANLTIVSTAHLDVDPAAFNAYLQAQAAASGTVQVPVTFGVCGISLPIYLVLDNVSITYSLLDAVNRAPVFSGQVPDLAVVAGGANLSAYDLTSNFADVDVGILNFRAEVVAGSDAQASGLTVAVNGSHVELRAANASWWGEVVVRFSASDTFNATVRSNDVTVHILPKAPANAPGDTQILTASLYFSSDLCGPADFHQIFRVPYDAVVTSALVELVAAANFTAPSAQVSVVAGEQTVVQVKPADLPKTIPLNASAINAQLRGQAAIWGIVDLDLSVSVCPSAGRAVGDGSVRIAYARPGGTGAGPGPTLPSIVAIAFDGAVTTTVDSGKPLVLEVRANESLGSNVEVSWYIDGAFAGNGKSLQDVRLAPGDHVVEVRVSDGIVTRSYTMQVSAA